MPICFWIKLFIIDHYLFIFLKLRYRSVIVIIENWQRCNSKLELEWRQHYPVFNEKKPQCSGIWLPSKYSWKIINQQSRTYSKTLSLICLLFGEVDRLNLTSFRLHLVVKWSVLLWRLFRLLHSNAKTIAPQFCKSGNQGKGNSEGQIHFPILLLMTASLFNLD